MGSRLRRYAAMVVLGAAVAVAAALLGPDCKYRLVLRVEPWPGAGGVALADLSARLRPLFRQAIATGPVRIPIGAVGELPANVRADGTRYNVGVYHRDCRRDETWFIPVFLGSLLAIAGVGGVTREFLGDYETGRSRR